MLTNEEKLNLLETLAEEYGMDEFEMLQSASMDSIVPGICYKCGYTTEVEPDQRGGWCEECNKGTVLSCLVLADVI